MRKFLIDPFQAADGPPPKTLLAFMGWAIKGSWPVLGVASVLSILAGVLEILAALLLGWVVDAALNSNAETVIADNAPLLIASLVFFIAIRPVLLGLAAYSQSILMQPNVLNLALSRLHRHTLGQAVTFFDDDFAGRIAQKEMQTARAINDVVTDMIHTVLFAIASVIGALAMLGTLNWQIASLMALWMVAYVFLIAYFMPRIRAKSKARAGARATITGQIVDTVTNIKTVKLFAHDQHEDQAALGSMARYREKFIAYGWVSVAFRVSLMSLAGLLPVLLVGSALWLWQSGSVTAGEIAAIGTIALRLAQMTGWVSFTMMGMYANVGEIEDGMRTLSPHATLLDADDAKPLNITKGEIELRDVVFTYGRETGGIDGVSLKIKSGEKLGLIGASGAGKSTLVALLLRLYDRENGAILIDGQDISQVTQESLRRQIGMVTQETAMFNRSAFDNIAYGAPEATRDDVIRAAKAAEAHEFIQTLQDHAGRTGYDAHLGERGVKLSGGQRQRIAIARAMLKDAPILLLDEATSALDSEVEASIQDALDAAMQDKTVLAIAHRLSTIARMDRIIVLDQGRIAEAGTHRELLALDGLYARYWARQSGGFIGLEAAE